MPRTKSISNRQRHNGSAKSAEVLTLAEAADYLRITEQDVLKLIHEQDLPARRVGRDWRFLRAAVAGWLASSKAADPGKFWNTHFGALQDDPYLDEMLHGIYQRRGRPETDRS